MGGPGCCLHAAYVCHSKCQQVQVVVISLLHAISMITIASRTLSSSDWFAAAARPPTPSAWTRESYLNGMHDKTARHIYSSTLIVLQYRFCMDGFDFNRDWRKSIFPSQSKTCCTSTTLREGTVVQQEALQIKLNLSFFIYLRNSTTITSAKQAVIILSAKRKTKEDHVSLSGKTSEVDDRQK